MPLDMPRQRLVAGRGIATQRTSANRFVRMVPQASAPVHEYADGRAPTYEGWTRSVDRQPSRRG